MRGVKFRLHYWLMDGEGYDCCPKDMHESTAKQALVDTYSSIGCLSFNEYIDLSEDEVKDRLRKLLNETPV